MKRWLYSLVAAGGVLVMGACGGGEVVVQAQLERQAGEPQPLANLVIRALPYDRDVIFDSLRAAHAVPEPEIPDSLLQLQARIAQAQERDREATAQWNAARDSLRQLQEQLQRTPRQAPQYRLLFADFGQQEQREAQAKRQMDQAFSEFTQLQNRFASQAQELRVRRELWGDEAFVAVDSVIQRRLQESRRQEYADTANASGISRFRSLPSGQWWIHARHDLPFEELYWNVPVQVERGDPTQIILNRSNAQVRPKL